jgi:hypothetical protein
MGALHMLKRTCTTETSKELKMHLNFQLCDPIGLDRSTHVYSSGIGRGWDEIRDREWI